MLRFNILDPEVISGVSRFQYILCYGSTFLWIFIVLCVRYFNTSYVTVQHALTIIRTYIFIISIHLMLRFNLFKIVKIYNVRSNFNTSYVTVQHFLFQLLRNWIFYFNTSYVTVQHRFSLLFQVFFKNFNTSYVTVQP